MDLLDVLRHLAVHGPARNQAEAEAFVAAIDQAAGQAAPTPAGEPVSLASLVKKES